MAAIAAFHLVPGGDAVAFLLVIPAIWLGAVAGLYGAFFTVAATLVLYASAGHEAGVPFGGWAELMVIVAFAGLVSGGTAMVADMWEDRVARLAAALTDVERHQAHIEAILEAVPVGMVELGVDGSYLSMNDRHREFVLALGFPVEPASQSAQPRQVYAADNRRLLEHHEMPSVRATAGDTFDDYILWLGGRPEERRAASVSSRQMRRKDGTSSGAVLAYHDVTDLMRALRVKDDFVASVSHELRTPLTSIIGYLDLAQDAGEELPADVAHFLTVASRNADRMHVLVSDLLAAADGSGVAIQLARTVVDLTALVQVAIAATTDAAHQGSVTLHAQLEPIPPVLLDEARIRQVLENLLRNAVKYTQPGGSVTVSLALLASEIVLEVTDTGMGISASDQLHLFDKFFRAENVASSTIPGIGMGLALSQEVVRAHDGRIEVTSDIETGTTMRVYLPVVDQGAVAEAPATSA